MILKSKKNKIRRISQSFVQPITEPPSILINSEPVEQIIIQVDSNVTVIEEFSSEPNTIIEEISESEIEQSDQEKDINIIPKKKKIEEILDNKEQIIEVFNYFKIKKNK